jgi:hypothetical protein
MEVKPVDTLEMIIGLDIAPEDVREVVKAVIETTVDPLLYLSSNLSYYT